MKNNIIGALAFLTVTFAAGFFANAADATKAAAPAPTPPTLESVAKERDDLKAENAALKADVAQLRKQVAQLQAAAQELVNQRDQILQSQINAAVQRADQSPPSK